MKKSLKYLIRFFIGGIILILLFYKIGFGEVYNVILNMNILFLPIIFFLYFINVIIGSLNLKILFNPLSRISFRDILKYHLISWSIGLFVPGKLGEFSLALFVRKENINLGKGLAVSLIDKLMTLSVLLGFAIIGFILFLDQIWTIVLLIIIVIGIMLFTTFLFSRKLREFIITYILRKHKYKFEGFSSTIRDYIKTKKYILIINLFFTLLKTLVMVLMTYFIFLSFNANVSIFLILIIMSISIVSELIPISISGLGIKQAVGVALYSQVGVSTIISAGNYLFLFAVNYGLASLVILYYIIFKGIKLKI